MREKDSTTTGAFVQTLEDVLEESIVGTALWRNSQEITTMREIEREDPIEMWDERLWVTTLDSATMFPDGSMEFRFYNGQSIRVDSEKK